MRYLYLRGSTYVYRRVIPPELRSLAGGLSEFKESLRTDESTTAVIRYGDVHTQVEAKLDQLRNGKPLTSRDPLPATQLREIAKSHLGLPYRSIDEQIQQPSISEMMTKIAVWEKAGRPSNHLRDAIFGTVAEAVTLNQILAYYERHTRDELVGLNSRAIAKKQNPVRLAVRRFEEFAGAGVDIPQMSRTLANEFRSYLTDQIEAGDMIASTANKQIIPKVVRADSLGISVRMVS
jgi:hypothetical protein